jgi:hypothetical protein
MKSRKMNGIFVQLSHIVMSIHNQPGFSEWTTQSMIALTHTIAIR